MIEIENLTKHFGDNAVVRNVSFNVEKNETVGLFGPAGAGKTTLIRMLTAYMFPTSGKLQILGYNIFNKSHEIRRRVGYLPQNAPLYPDMTVESYLKFVLRLHKVGDRSECIHHILEKLQLTDHPKTLIGKLPLHLYRRVGLAQAVVHKPELLLLDEPTLGLEPHQIVEFYEFIKALTGRYTIILGTQTWREAEQFCNRVLMMDQGQIIGERSLRPAPKQTEIQPASKPVSASVFTEIGPAPHPFANR
ncbi:MAG: ABC transporter ATP-binding protein [Anaerolineae bacterium]|nr:ABC transporter ATP-binding protein [Anaerolineae bacterium]